MLKIDFKDAIVIIKNSIRKAIKTLKLLPENKHCAGIKQSFVDALCKSQKNKSLKIIPRAKDIDFMDKVLINFIDPLNKEEKYLILAHADGIKRKIIALNLAISRQAVHQKYEKVLQKILKYAINNQSLTLN